MKNSEVFTQPRLGRILELTLVLTILVMPKVMEARLEWTNIQTSTSRGMYAIYWALQGPQNADHPTALEVLVGK